MQEGKCRQGQIEIDIKIHWLLWHCLQWRAICPGIYEIDLMVHYCTVCPWTQRNLNFKTKLLVCSQWVNLSHVATCLKKFVVIFVENAKFCVVAAEFGQMTLDFFHLTPLIWAQVIRSYWQKTHWGTSGYMAVPKSSSPSRTYLAMAVGMPRFGTRRKRLVVGSIFNRCVRMVSLAMFPISIGW